LHYFSRTARKKEKNTVFCEKIVRRKARCFVPKEEKQSEKNAAKPVPGEVVRKERKVEKQRKTCCTQKGKKTRCIAGAETVKQQPQKTFAVTGAEGKQIAEGKEQVHNRRKEKKTAASEAQGE
jgi:hypothetical protein